MAFLRRRAALPIISADSTAKEVKMHIMDLRMRLDQAQRANNQSASINLLPDVFSWQRGVQKASQTSRPTDHDDDDWKTIPHFFATAIPGKVNLGLFSTYWGKGVAGVAEFQAHAWIGIAIGTQRVPMGWATGVWDPSFTEMQGDVGSDPLYPGQATLDKIATELPNQAFFLTRMGMSAYTPLWHGGGNPEDRDRKPEDCLAACLAWLGQVCRGELLSETHPEAMGYIKLEPDALRELGFVQIGKVDPHAENRQPVPQGLPWMTNPLN